jgi:hypothetical protein
MRRKLWTSLLVIALLDCAALAWTHFQRVDLEMATKVADAEKERHGYVISHDFGLIKEKLIESHRDHWVQEARMQQLARWEFAGILTLLAILIALILMELRNKKSPRAQNSQSL